MQTFWDSNFSSYGNYIVYKPHLGGEKKFPRVAPSVSSALEFLPLLHVSLKLDIKFRVNVKGWADLNLDPDPD